MQRVLRFLLVCFLAAAMPLKGMAMVLMLAGGGMPPAGAAQVAPAHAAHAAQMGHLAHMGHIGHIGHMGRYEAMPADHALPCASAATGHGHEAKDAPFAHKCSACDACAAAAPLPAVPLHIAPPEAGLARFEPLAQAPVRFVTDGPDRPPRRHLA